MRSKGRRLFGAAAFLLWLPCAGNAADSGGGANPALGSTEAPNPAPFTLEQRFLDAARRGDRNALERTLERGVSLEAKDDLGRGALLLATKDAGSLELVRWLRAKGAAPDVPDAGGRAALSFAAAEGRIDLVRELLAAGAELDRRDEDGRTPLFHAVSLDHRDVAELLLARGADVNAADRFGDTALMMACAKGLGTIAIVLLEHGADPERQNQEGRTARERAAAGAEACRMPAPAS